MKKTFTVALGLAIFCMFAVDLNFGSRRQEVSWRVPTNFATIQEAIDAPGVMPGDTIIVEGGEHAGAYVAKAVEIRGEGQAIISSGPMHPAGLSMGFRLVAGSSGASINHLVFEVDLAIMNGGAVNDVTVDHCTFNNTIQAISNWRGSGWVISHNDINDLRTRNGGGIGILVGDYMGGTVKDNLISHNKINGVVHVASADGGGYNGSGIVLYADFRWGGAGTLEMLNNRVVKNKVSLISDTSSVVDVAAFELTDSRDDPEQIVIFNNAIGFNDFRGTTLQIMLTPSNLDQFNDISRNLGENRGHGLHPKAFRHDE